MASGRRPSSLLLGIVAACLIASVGAGSWGVVKAAEAGIQEAATESLAQANLLVQVQYNGFDAIVSGDPELREKALEIIREVPGTLHVSWEGDSTAGSGGATPSSTASGSPEKTTSASETSSISPSASQSVDPSASLDPSELELPSVQFDGGETKISAGSEQVVTELADLMKQWPELEVVLTGHTDNGKSADFRAELSLARAQTVADMLVEFGINSDRISVLGRSSSEPKVSNSTEAGRVLNRRVEIEIVEG